MPIFIGYFQFPMSKNQNLKIIYEDNHLLVVCKPPGILIQGDVTGDITVLSIAKEYLKERCQKPGNVYLGLVHRLDRPRHRVLWFLPELPKPPGA